MTARIEPLPLDVVHLIAAGEVIDSLAAVVRELAENALDAGATRISLAIYPEQGRVRLADNGIGMELADLQQAASPHSTSKIRNSGDLNQIASLGFRGEALHSLAQLADLEIISRVASQSEGWWVKYDSLGQSIAIEPAAIAPGTVVIAANIFGRWAARQQGLPPIPQQLKAVQAIIYQLALCHPQVTWQVQQGDRDWFNLWSGKTARQILPQILRDVQVHDLQELTIEVGEKGSSDFFPSSASLYVLLGLPDRCHRHRPDWVKVALNGRFVQLPELEQTILAAFRRTLPRDRFPVCLIHLQVPPDQIDWNRHPAKTEVYLHHLADWREQVTHAIAEILRLHPLSVSETLYSDRVGKVLKTAEAESAYNAYSNQQHDVLPAAALRAVAQIHNMYILAEHPTGVWLIEQHIAHERVLYEQLCDRWQIVPLPSPLVLQNLTTAQVSQLRRLGMDIEPFGVNAWVVRSAPELLVPRADCAAALQELSLGGDLQTAQVATACRSAIRNGTPLTLPEMQTLLNQWQQTRQPRTCPHGRPICLSLEESTLSRFFRRHWVIGKSHGI